MENSPHTPNEIDAKTFEEEVMRTMGAKFTVIPTSSADQKLAKDFLEILPKLKTKNEGALSVLARFFTLPTITDDFPNHNERILFLKKLESEPALYRYYETNKLKRDNLTSLFLALDLLEMNKELTKDEKVKEAGLFLRIQNYNDLLSLEDKFTYIEDMTEFCREIINRRMKEER